MSFDINEYLKNIEQKKKKETEIKGDIERKEEEFKESIKPFKDSLIKIKREIGELKSTKICIRLGDLIEELSSLSGINIDSISTELKTTIDLSNYKNVEDLVKRKLPKEQLRLIIVGSKNLPFNETHPHPFCFSIKSPFNFSDIQADGKTFFEHCSIKVKNNNKDKKQYIEFLVNNNPNDIICNFSLATLLKEEKENFYPSALLKQAIINCIEKKDKLDTEKVYSKKTQ